MNDATNLPEDDRDLELARRIGERLDAGDPAHSPLEEASPPLFQAVDAWKQAQPGAPPAATSDRLWNQIHHRIEADATIATAPSRPPARPAARLYRLGLAVAAVIALVFVGRALFLPVGEASVAAESDQDTVIYEAPDGSRITLRPHSRLLAWGDGQRHYRLEGEAYFDVASDAEHPFRVETSLGSATVLGTRFVLSTWGEMTQLYVEEGRVQLGSNATGETAVVTAGERSRIAASGTLAAPAPDAGTAYTDWLQAEVTFTKQPLAEVAAELEQHFAVRLLVPQRLQQETLSGRILLGTKEQAIRDLGLVMGGRFEATSIDTYRFVAE